LKFPSLIGRLKTQQVQALLGDAERFPSLIGRLKTIYNTALAQRKEAVSIPHRKTKNPIAATKREAPNISFHPS